MKKVITCLLMLTLMVSMAGPLTIYSEDSMMTYYVSVTGDDNNTGTKDSPFKTLIKAQRTVQELDELPDGGVTIYLREGVYQMDYTLKFYRNNSGTEASPITYENYNNEKVFISGGKHLNKADFTPVTDQALLDTLIEDSAKSGLLVADLAALGIEDTGELSRRGYVKNEGHVVTQMELFVEDQRMTLSRWPNYDTILFNEIIENGSVLTDGEPLTNGPILGMPKAFERSADWSDIQNIWVDNIVSYDWVWSYNKVEEINATDRTVEFSYGTNHGVFSWGDTRGLFFANIFEEIDMPGEYYIDRENMLLYYYPTQSFTEKENPEIMLSELNVPLLSFSNTSYVNFKGIQFDGTRNDVVECFDGDNHHITFEGVTIKNSGESGLLMTGDSLTIKDSNIFNLGSAGIRMKGGNKETLEVSNNLIENSHIYNIGQIRKGYNPAMSIDGVGVTLRNNLVNDTPHMAMTIRGNDHLIEYNEFYNISQRFRDIGILYFNLGGRPFERGTKVYRNYFHDYWSINDEHGDNNGIYLDNGTQGVFIEENIFYNSDVVGIFTHGGGFNHMSHNVFIDISGPYRDVNFMQTGWGYWIIKNTVATWANQRETMDFASMPHAKYDRLVEFYEFSDEYVEEMTSLETAEDDRPWNKFGATMQNAQPDNVFMDNLMVNINNPLISQHVDGVWRNTGHGTFSAVVESGSYVTDVDPGFVDYASKDFTFKEDSVVFDEIQGFPMIPFTEMGLKVTDYRSELPSASPGKLDIHIEGYKENETVILKQGDTFVVGAKVVPESDNAAVVYHSSNPDIASVDSKGLVTAKGTGFVEITAHSENNLDIFGGHMFRVDKNPDYVEPVEEEIPETDSEPEVEEEKADTSTSETSEVIEPTEEEPTNNGLRNILLGVGGTFLVGAILLKVFKKK